MITSLTIVDASRIGISVSGVQNGSLAQLDGLLLGHVLAVVAAINIDKIRREFLIQ
jgi:hypothetical protein